ncbi:ABC transporter ATP-binding protein [Gallaecimonas kandeliae]|uniref:ABC transporter ATP-binding protein n=1 Tax=Gallaecimonas kandeliae TaxID=3029055 RepID=UPI002649E209|nr:ABC transporter ATP-binding protein [Gallaecimonas kandeliae]WKE65629.1 ABC transporter ATP-binding protein [Gallaecimonas kandeliae]
MIQLEGISKVYQTDEMETHALRGVDLTISKGDYLSISGPSGCGKSTLLSILGLLDTPSAGRYTINGQDVTLLDSDQRSEVRNRNIGLVFQSFNLIDGLSVAENVALPLHYRGIPRDEIKDKVSNALNQVELGHRLSHRPNQLSGGQQQRVAIARAIVGEPSLLLVDEATGNLDTKNSLAVMALLQSLNEKGTTICMVTHEPQFAAEAKTRLQLLDGGLVTDDSLRKAI